MPELKDPDIPMPVGERSEPGERFARVDDVELCYQELGDPDGEPLLLVMGLGTQLIHWHPRFCELLGEQGFRVIRFDNRDAGRSTIVDAPSPPRVPMMLGLSRGLAYPLKRMADDAVGLLEALGISSAHVAGVSMGGMIAQVAAVRSPARVRSLALIMSGAGKRTSSLPRLRALGTLLTKPARSREEFVDTVTKTFEVIGSPGYPMDAEREREFRATLATSWDRGHHPAGVARQLHAITASGDRSRALRGVEAPTIVIHGDSDPLVRPAAGKALAKAIPGAELRIVEGMGHDMPPALFGELAGAIAANARRASSARRSAPVAGMPAGAGVSSAP